MCIKVNFENWVKEASKDLGKAIKLDVDRSDIWFDKCGYDNRKADLLPYYLQYKMWEANRYLVWATWALAIATILLIIFK